MKIDLTATAGARPTWLKDDDLTTVRYYRSCPHDNYCEPFPASECLIDWGDDLIAIEIEDTHPYAMATSEGFTYHEGSPYTPADCRDKTDVLFRSRGIGPSRHKDDWDWKHFGNNGGYEIIGYHRATSQPLQTYNVSTNIKFEVKATDATEANARAVSLLEDMRLVSYGGLVITEPVDPDLMLVRKIFAEQADNDNCPATADEIREGYQDHSRNIRLALAAVKAARA